MTATPELVLAQEAGERLVCDPQEPLLIFGPERAVRFVSAAAREALGLGSPDRLPLAWHELFATPSASRPLAEALRRATDGKTAAFGSFARPAAGCVRWFDFVLFPQFGRDGGVEYIVTRLREAEFAGILARSLREAAGPPGEGRSSLPLLIPPLLDAGMTLTPATERWLAALRPETALLAGDFEPLRLALVQLALCAHIGSRAQALLAVTPRDAGGDARYLSLEFQGYGNVHEFRMAGWEEIRALIESYGGTAVRIQPPGGDAIIELILRFEDLAG